MAEALKNSLNESGKRTQDDGPWGEDYQKNVPAFNEENNKNRNEKKIDRECVQVIRNLLGKEELNPIEEYDELVQYAQKRRERYEVNNPINVYLRFESMKRLDANSSGLVCNRYNPQTGEYYREKRWRHHARAYHSSGEGTFIDIKATPNKEARKPREEQENVLRGYERVSEIINFAYTVEHELQHDVQQQRLNSGEISYSALRTARDHVVLHCLPRIKNGNYFYINAHNDFFVEEEANDSADDFLSKVLPTDSNLYDFKFLDPDGLRGQPYRVGDVLESRAMEGRLGVGKEHTLIVDETTLRIEKRTYNGKAEEIISDLCDDLIQAYPEFLTTYPVLLLEYGPDGTHRKREDIEKSMAMIDKEGGNLFNGKEVNPVQLKTAYHKLLTQSKKLR